MLTSLGVQNLRSFRDFTSIDLKPITVLIGKNSSGKSSFLRVLPLFRQSTQEATNGPILWYGRLVDFGDFNGALTNNSLEKEISFYFCLRVEERLFSSRFHYYDPTSSRDNEISIGVKLTVTNPNQKTITKSIEITIDKTSLKIDYDKNLGENNLTVWNDSYKIEKAITILTSDGELLPKIMPAMSDQESKTVRHYPFEAFIMRDEYFSGINSEPLLNVRKKNKAFYKELVSDASLAIKTYFHNRTSIEKIESLLSNPLTKLSEDAILRSLKKTAATQTTFLKNLSTCKNNGDELKILQTFAMLSNFNLLTNSLNEQLRKCFTSVKYIGPSRAIAERYYRFQDLQVNTLDHTGSNFAMILNSLPVRQKSKFKQWTKTNFGFSVNVSVIDSHYAVNIRTDEDDNEYNISDMGFGYSQVLPIIMSVWLEMEKARGYHNDETIFVIEQPELHLHPAYQSKLAKVFALLIAHIKKQRLNVKIIFETHSQAMIDSFGESIEDPDINFNNSDISVNVFEKSNKYGTKTYRADFNENGFFENWPVGFFTGN
ncbi:AAA family ATPase [Rahnella aceris]|uniref:AAA family ATPase n=1 Tax=Rahnella sp. (strain Y9602) TaxID=2703885 RepID=UPI0019052EF1|nr:AAA family ATPase [Rahnella aceris]QQN36629.1 AAA family ATPase [Rahnella aceris]